MSHDTLNTPLNEEALRRAAAGEEASPQLPPLAADLEGLAVSLGVLAGRVSAGDWEFLKCFRANLRAAAERTAALESHLESHLEAHLESHLEAPHEG